MREISKKCGKCCQVKPVEQFHRSSKTKDGATTRCKPCSNAVSREYHKKNYNPVKTREMALKRRYGITTDNYYEMLIAQGGKCAICGIGHSKSVSVFFSVDHCHKTGKVRGLLCKPCNTGLGHLKDNISNLNSAIKYLEASSERD